MALNLEAHPGCAHQAVNLEYSDMLNPSRDLVHLKRGRKNSRGNKLPAKAECPDTASGALYISLHP